MENVSKALIIAFSMLMFAAGFGYAMYLINSVTATSSTLLETVTAKNYYDNIKVSGDDTTKRIVGVETIIPVLYRYARRKLCRKN